MEEIEDIIPRREVFLLLLRGEITFNGAHRNSIRIFHHPRSCRGLKRRDKVRIIHRVMDGGSRLISHTDWPSVTSTPRVSPEATEPTTPQNETVDNLRPKSHRPSRTKEPPTIEITPQNSNPDGEISKACDRSRMTFDSQRSHHEAGEKSTHV